MAKKTKKQGVGCLLLFSLPFAGVGVFMAWLALSTTFEWWQMQGWVETEAQILHTSLDEHHDGEGGTTYEALAEYRYEFQGQQYTGDRVSISSTADNIGKYHQRKASLLRSHFVNKKPIPCYVNPRSPAESILFPELRVEKLAFYLLFVLLFGGFGCVAFGFNVFGKKKQSAEEALKETHPDEPWMWRPDWAKGEIRSASKATMIATILFAAFWNLVSSPLLFILPDELRKGNHLASLGFLFPVVGVGLIVWAVRSTLRWLKYGDTVFQMPETPGVIGGQLVGVVRIPSKVRTTSGFKNTLSCIHRYTTSSGDSQTTTERVLWQQSQTIAQELSPSSSSSAIPVQFQIPYGEKQSEDDRIIWKLEVDADTAGTDFHVEFEVPVFETEESSPDFQPQTDAISPYIQDETIESTYRKCKVRREKTQSGIRITFPLFRNIGAALSLTAFLAIWTGAIGLMLHLEAPLFFPIVFGFFELLLILFAFELWLWSSQIDVSSEQITIRSGIPFFTSQRTFTTADIKKMDVATGMQSGKTLYHDLRLIDVNDEKLLFGKRIANQVVAKAILDDILDIMTSSRNSAVESDAEPSLANG